MRPLLLVLQGIQSYREWTEFDFSGLGFAVFTGRNGSGKSTAAQYGIENALFGITPASLEDFVSTGVDEGRVEFTFEEADQIYRVIRGRARKGKTWKPVLSFTRQNGDEWEPFDGANAADTDAKIAATLHMSADLWKATICAGGARAVNIMDLLPSERKAHLAEILGLGWYAEECAKARRELIALQAQYDAGAARVEDLTRQAEEAEALQAQLAELAAKLKVSEEELQSAAHSLQAAQEARGALQALHVGVRARETELARLRAAVDDKRVDANIRREDLSRIGKQLAGASDLADRIAKAEEAEKTAAGWEEKRQDDSANLLEAGQERAAMQLAGQKWEADCKTIAARIDTARQKHNTEIAALVEKCDRLEEQVKIMGEVPCIPWQIARGSGSGRDGDALMVDLAGTCPLLKIAHAAEELLPETRALLADAKTVDAGDEDARKLARIEAENPATIHEDRLARLEKARRGIGYDPAIYDMARKTSATLPDLRKQQADLAGHRATQEAMQKQLDALMLELGTLTEQRDIAASDPDLKRDWGNEIAETFDAVTKVEQDVERLRSELSAAEREKAVTGERLAKAEQAAKDATALETERAGVRDRIRRTQIVAEAWSVKGVPARLMENALPQWENAANDLLGVLSDGALTLAVVTQKDLKAGGVAETLDVEVADWRGTRAFATYSDGQRCMVNMALRLGLAQVLATQAGARCETLILDEPGEGLDDERQGILIAALGRLYRDGRFGQVLVVSHLDSFREAAPQRWQFTLEADGSRMEVLS